MTDPICKHCNDTHNIENAFGERRMCTDCPTPCQKCRANGNGPYCQHTPCDCECHKKDHMIPNKQQIIDALHTVISPEDIAKVIEKLADAIYSNPCKFLTPGDAAALRRGLTWANESERKDAIIAGIPALVRQRDTVIKTVSEERDARIAECNAKNDQIVVITQQLHAAERALSVEKERHVLTFQTMNDQIQARCAELNAARSKLINVDQEIASLRSECRQIEETAIENHSRYVAESRAHIATFNKLTEAEAARDENFNKYKNACDAVSDLDIKYARTGSEIRRLEASVAGYVEIKAKLEEKIKNQRERIHYLEGATHHACGTPLTVATKELEAEKAKTAELRGIVDTLRGDIEKWKEQAAYCSQDESVKIKAEMEDIKMLLRSQGQSAYDNPAKRLGDIIEEYGNALRSAQADAKFWRLTLGAATETWDQRVMNAEQDAERWRALLKSARVRALGNSGLCEGTLAPAGYAHLGLELTTTCCYDPKQMEKENKIGIEWLTKYADIMREVLANKKA